MKKSDKIMLAIYIVIGIALVIIGVTIQVDYYSSMIFAMGFALIFSSILQFLIVSIANGKNTQTMKGRFL